MIGCGSALFGQLLVMFDTIDCLLALLSLVYFFFFLFVVSSSVECVWPRLVAVQFSLING